MWTRVAYTNNGYTGAFRGFGNTEVTTCIEQAIDDLAARLDMDPIDLRLANCLRPGDETVHGQRLGDDVALVECLQQVRRDADWDRKRREYVRRNEGSSPLRRGIVSPASFTGSRSRVKTRPSAAGRNADDTLTLTSGLTDYGTGSGTVFTLIAGGPRRAAGAHPYAPADTATVASPHGRIIRHRAGGKRRGLRRAAASVLTGAGPTCSAAARPRC